MKKALDLNGVKIYDDENNTAEALNLIGQFGYFSNSKNFENYSESILAGVDCSYKQIWEPSSEFVVKVKVVQINPFPYLAMLADAQQAMSGDANQYKYFILEKDAKFKEETSRPCYRKFKSIDEFEFITQNHFSMGESVIFRSKETLNESELVYGGFFVNDQSETLICLGAFVFSLDELFNKYEFHINNSIEEWHPFGIKE